MFAFIEDIFVKAYESFTCVGVTYIRASVIPNILKEPMRTNWTKSRWFCA